MFSVIVVRYGKRHSDRYVWDGERQVWQRFYCNLDSSMDCTAPSTLPRGASKKGPGYLRTSKDDEYQAIIAATAR